MKRPIENTDSDWLLLVRRHFKKNWWWELIVTALLFCGLLPLLAHFIGLQELAEIGEAFIIWHSLFEALACILLGITLFVQFYDVRQKEVQFDKQIKAQRIQSVFFPYLMLFNSYVGSFPVAFETLKQSLAEHGDEPGLPSAIQANRDALAHYNRHLTVLLELIGSADISIAEKNDYLRVLHAQLSEDQLIVIRTCLKFEFGKDLMRILAAIHKQDLDDPNAERLDLHFLTGC